MGDGTASFRDGLRKGNALPNGDFAGGRFCKDGERACSGDGAADVGAMMSVALEM